MIRIAISAAVLAFSIQLSAFSSGQVCGPGGCGPSPIVSGGWQAAGVGSFGRAQICQPGGGQAIIRGGLGGAGFAAGGYGAAGGYAQSQRSAPTSDNLALVMVAAPIGSGLRNAGTGFVAAVRRDLGGRGLVVTAAHNFIGATSVSLTFADGATAPGKLLVADAATDVALVEFIDPHSKWWKIVLADEPATAGTRVTWHGYRFDQQKRSQVQGQAVVRGYRGNRLVLTGQMYDEGHSGGPIIDQNCRVVGLISERGEADMMGPHVGLILAAICRYAPWALPESCPAEKSPPAAGDLPLPGADADAPRSTIPDVPGYDCSAVMVEVKRNAAAIAEIRAELVEIRRDAKPGPPGPQGPAGVFDPARLSDADLAELARRLPPIHVEVQWDGRPLPGPDFNQDVRLGETLPLNLFLSEPRALKE